MFIHSNKVILSADIGGSHVTAAIVNMPSGEVVNNSLCKAPVDAQSDNCKPVIDQWLKVFQQAMKKSGVQQLDAISIAMPGPFDYPNGVSLINGVAKYYSLFGINIKEAIANQMGIDISVPVFFENDASCFGLGESTLADNGSFENIIAITLGTGLGAAFIRNQQLINSGPEVPDNGYLYNVPFKEKQAEDYLSARWLLGTFNKLSDIKVEDVKEIAEQALVYKNETALKLFDEFGRNLGECLAPWLRAFRADCLVLGGNIAKAAELFMPSIFTVLKDEGINLPIKISKEMEMSAIKGAAKIATVGNDYREEDAGMAWRKTTQDLLPLKVEGTPKNRSGYTVFPYKSLGYGKINTGYGTLADWIIQKKKVAIDGYQGNDWKVIRQKLAECFQLQGLKVLWYEAEAFLKSPDEIETLVEPYLGGKDAVWGKVAPLDLEDFFEREQLKNLQLNDAYDVAILIGTGAALCAETLPLVYIDLPKNEIQYRMKAGSACNIGAKQPENFASMYKRAYFVDWVVLNNYRQHIKNRIEIVADGQWRDDINWMSHSSLCEGFEQLSHSPIRARPWFAAGAWGGDWMRDHFDELNKDEINYAWSFELIVPENGLVFESDGHLLEVAFDWLMEYNPEHILGKDAEIFGTTFPIRFDFLDTFNGSNLSIQCHPSLSYIQENFGEQITQDETYYILDCEEGAKVYLGFQEDINPKEFKEILTDSFESNTPVDIEKYVQIHDSEKHGLYLIPNGTIHSSGSNNLVLEISATPYIFTFKMYDWLQRGLDGKPRPINIERGFQNLNFDRKGERVKQELIAKPYVLTSNEQFKLIHLPTHAEHFYDIHRIEFDEQADISTEGKCHILMLVEGTEIAVKSPAGDISHFFYAETFVIPANQPLYQLINMGEGTAKVIKAFLK